MFHLEYTYIYLYTYYIFRCLFYYSGHEWPAQTHQAQPGRMMRSLPLATPAWLGSWSSAPCNPASGVPMMLPFLLQNHSNKIYWNTLRMLHKIFWCSISYNHTISTNSGHGVAGVHNCSLDLLAQTCIPTIKYVWAHAVNFNVTDPLMYSEPLRSTIFTTPVPVLFLHSFYFLADLVPPQLLHNSLCSSTYDEQTFFVIYLYFISAFASLQLVIPFACGLFYHQSPARDPPSTTWWNYKEITILSFQCICWQECTFMLVLSCWYWDAKCLKRIKEAFYNSLKAKSYIWAASEMLCLPRGRITRVVQYVFSHLSMSTFCFPNYASLAFALQQPCPTLDELLELEKMCLSPGVSFTNWFVYMIHAMHRYNYIYTNIYKYLQIYAIIQIHENICTLCI